MFTSRATTILRSRAVAAPRAAGFSGSRLLHATPSAQKTVTEKVSEVADKVNKSVGKGLAGAIDKGEKATHAVKDTIETVTKDTSKKAGETATKAKQKTHQAEAGAREAKRDFETEVRK